MADLALTVYISDLDSDVALCAGKEFVEFD
jgi:hypothetical protein